MRVTLIGQTRFLLEDAIDAAHMQTGKTWMPDPGRNLFASDDQNHAALLSEFAGRACYESFDRPNAHTAKTRDYIAHILEDEHLSVLEHGSVSFYITEPSRAFTHELVRHRHFSFSQLSQRFARVAKDAQPVVPPLFEDNRQAETIITGFWIQAVEAYQELVAIGESIARDAGLDGTARRKAAREAARCVLPNMTPTAIVVTGNHRSWREFLAKRATEHADAEMCEAAVRIWDFLHMIEPHLYQDFSIDTTKHGRVVLYQAKDKEAA